MEKKDVVDEARAGNGKEQTVGEEILQEISDAKDEKHKKIMKQHLKWCLRRVDELKENKVNVDEALLKASEELTKVSRMTLDAFGAFIKEQNFQYESEFVGTVDNNKRLLHSKLKMTFRDKY